MRFTLESDAMMIIGSLGRQWSFWLNNALEVCESFHVLEA